jgi:hypothetical protein
MSKAAAPAPEAAASATPAEKGDTLLTAAPPAKVAETKAVEAVKTDPKPEAGDSSASKAEGQTKPGETKTAAAQPAEPAKVVPEKYDLKAPEQSTMSAAHLERIASEAKERGLTAQEAQALVERDARVIALERESLTTAWDGTRKAWREEAQADKEFGGERFKESLEGVKRLLEKYAPPKLIEVLETTGTGDNPDLFRFLARLARAAREDKVPGGGAPAGGPLRAADAIYGEILKESMKP